MSLPTRGESQSLGALENAMSRIPLAWGTSRNASIPAACTQSILGLVRFLVTSACCSVKVILSSSGSLGGELQSQVGATNEQYIFLSNFNVQEDAQLQQGNSQLWLNTTRVGKINILGLFILHLFYSHPKVASVLGAHSWCGSGMSRMYAMICT